VHIATEDVSPLLIHTVSAFRIGKNDPTIHISDADVWRTSVTPDGPATLHISQWQSTTPIFQTYGDGAAWLQPRVTDFLGGSDAVPEITPAHEIVATAQKKFGRLLLGRSNTPYHELLHAVLAQRVTSIEATRQWREIVLRYGTPAPGPHAAIRTPPAPDVIASLPYHEFHRFGIERKRAESLISVAKYFDFLSRVSVSTAPAHELTAQLQKIPGVGVWTAAVAGGLAFGDPDALLVGDFHVKNTVAFALTGRIRGTDEEMVATLAPYHGQRHRVVRWLQLNGVRAPARGPRRRIVSITRL
jgi:endonuclease III